VYEASSTCKSGHFEEKERIVFSKDVLKFFSIGVSDEYIVLQHAVSPLLPFITENTSQCSVAFHIPSQTADNFLGFSKSTLPPWSL